MIARVWTARATRDGALGYREHFERRVAPAVRAIEGCSAARLLTRAGAEEVEIMVVTEWRSLDAIRSFAGADFERAVVAGEAAALLTTWDQRVRHYEIAVQG